MLGDEIEEPVKGDSCWIETLYRSKYFKSPIISIINLQLLTAAMKLETSFLNTSSLISEFSSDTFTINKSRKANLSSDIIWSYVEDTWECDYKNWSVILGRESSSLVDTESDWTECFSAFRLCDWRRFLITWLIFNTTERIKHFCRPTLIPCQRKH